MKVDAAIDKLNAAYKRLEPEQGRVARRNARRAYLDAVRALRKALDDEFPAIRKPVTKRKKRDPRRAVRGKERISQTLHRQLLAAGVSPSQFVERGKPGQEAHIIYGPKWMVRAHQSGAGFDTISKAVRSQKVRKRIDALARLKGRRG